MSTARAHRFWRQAGLQVPRRGPRRRVATSRPRPVPSLVANHVWAYDFVFDACANGQTLKCLTVIDEFTRECLAIDVAGGIRAGRVIEVLAQLVSVHGAPRYLRSDNGAVTMERPAPSRSNVDYAAIWRPQQRPDAEQWLSVMSAARNLQ